MRRIGVALLALCLAVGAIYVPACEYDSNGNPRPVAPAPTTTQAAPPAASHAPAPAA